MLTDAAKAVVRDADDRPFGAATVTGALAFNLRFPGQYYDDETGLHYNYFRDYDPSLGRYIQSDPIGLSGGWNSYAYVGGNPVMLVDPRGLAGNPKGMPPPVRGGGFVGAIECAKKIAAAWGPLKVGDKYKHCMVGGLITKGCGVGKGGGYAAGILKELKDLSGSGTPEVEDYVATADGADCADGYVGCEKNFQISLAACCLKKGRKP